jgi:hypothetical protein
VVQQAIQNRCGQHGVPDHRVPLGNRKLGGEDGGGPAVAILQNLQQEQPAGGIQDLQTEIIQLCGAPHNWINGETAVMWSRNTNSL